jgi:phosphate transport system protein
MIRENFEKNMTELQNKMKEMADLTIEAMENAFVALEKQDIDLALSIIEEDAYIDDLEGEINQMAVWIIAKQQPVSRDLRRIISMLKMSSDIERIADFAVNTAKSTIKIGRTQSLLTQTSILAMKNKSIEMMKLAIKAFADENLSLAKEVGELDDVVDQKNYANFALLKSLLKEHPERTDEIVELLLINRFVERAADHITNMAESTAYFIKGQLFDLN